MADEPQYGSKRKFDDPPSTPPPPRRPTGFSAPISSPPAAGPPPPVDEIELAKQRAQEIASRLFTNAEAKRPKIENGGGGDDSNIKGFGSAASDHSQKFLAQQSPSQGGMTLPFPVYGFQGSSKKIEIPNGRVGVIIGKGGETIRYLQLQSGAKIQVTRDMDHDPSSQTRPIELVGTPEQISKAEQLINDVLAEAETGGSGTMGTRKFGATQAGGEQFTMKVPNNKVGLIIGKGGEKIKDMQAKSGARIQLIPLHPPPGDTSTERTVQINGTPEQIELAKQLVNEVISENRVRVPSYMSGGYSQQGYRPPRPQTSWAPPGAPQMQQQPGYGYMQPGGAYTGQPPAYNMPQQPYGGYAPPPASGGFSSGWDQSSNPPAAQQTTPVSGYDYYNQQQPPQQQPQQPTGGSSTPGDTTSYNYSQPPATYSSQGSYADPTYAQPAVGQDGYSGAYYAPSVQSGYPSQTAPNPQAGYDQQGYGTSQPAYGAVTNPTQDGSAPTYTTRGAPTQAPPAQQAPTSVPPVTQQGYASQGYGAPPTGYVTQPPTQPGYAQPVPSTQPTYGQPLQGQKLSPTPAVYGQSPTTQPSYIQPAQAQAGYPPVQPGYGQDAASNYRPPGFAPGGPQPAYGQPQQPVYGQQPYGDSYGSTGYAQPPAYDASAATQPVPTGVAKVSPQT